MPQGDEVWDVSEEKKGGGWVSLTQEKVEEERLKRSEVLEEEGRWKENGPEEHEKGL